MSINNKVPIEYAIQEAKDNCDISDSSLDPIFKSWGKEAEIAIGTFVQFVKKIYVLTAQNCSIDIPCEIVGIGGIIPGDHGCDCNLLFSKAYGMFPVTSGYLPMLNVFAIGTGGMFLRPLKWAIQNNKIVFEQNYDGEVFTIQSWIYPCDGKGWMLINNSHIKAIAAYLEWRYMKRFNHKKGLGGYSATDVENQYKLWEHWCKQARGDDNKPTESEEQEIRTLWNDPLSGIQNTIWDTVGGGYYKTLGY